MAAAPDVVIDMGELKGSKESMVADLDSLQDDLLIPVIFIEAYLDNTPDVYRKLGSLLGAKEKGEALAGYAEDAIRMAAEARERITDPITVYYSISSDGSRESGTYSRSMAEVCEASSPATSSAPSLTSSSALETEGRFTLISTSSQERVQERSLPWGYQCLAEEVASVPKGLHHMRRRRDTSSLAPTPEASWRSTAAMVPRYSPGIRE